MNTQRLNLFVCPECRSSSLRWETYTVSGDVLVEGRAVCANCDLWYRVEQGIADLRTSRLRNSGAYRRFACAHGLYLDASAAFTEEHEEGVFDDVGDYERRVVNSPFYRALDEVVFGRWLTAGMAPGQRALDIGCGTGRQCIPLARQGMEVIALDVCDDMVMLAKEKTDRLGLSDRIDFVLADGIQPPVRDSTFDVAVCYGVLHHVSDPKMAVSAAAQTLRPGGRYYTLDPHASPVRFVFDAVMRIWRLYVEEASTAPLISENRLQDWFREAGFDGQTRLSTYLLPHLLMFTGQSFNVAVLRVTDALFRRLPGLRKFGGVIIGEAQKR